MSIWKQRVWGKKSFMDTFPPPKAANVLQEVFVSVCVCVCVHACVRVSVCVMCFWIVDWLAQNSVFVLFCRTWCVVALTLAQGIVSTKQNRVPTLTEGSVNTT